MQRYIRGHTIQAARQDTAAHLALAHFSRHQRNGLYVRARFIRPDLRIWLSTCVAVSSPIVGGNPSLGGDALAFHLFII